MGWQILALLNFWLIYQTIMMHALSYNALRVASLRNFRMHCISHQNDDKLYTALSFFKFIKDDIDPIDLQQRTQFVLQKDGIRGTLLIAREGLNGQFCVRDVDCFKSLLGRIDPIYSDIQFNVGQTIDYANQGVTFPFKRLLVKTKAAVLTDGLPEEAKQTIDWTDAGPELEAAQWHDEILDVVNADTDDQPDLSKTLILDCRNDYESEMGTFVGAMPLNTTKFSESWQALDDVLQNVDSSTRILTFCTGGIRCVKVNAYLKQRLGFKNIARLKNGIIAYENWLNEGEGADKPKATPSLFVGKNFLFDRRRLQSRKEELSTDDNIV